MVTVLRCAELRKRYGDRVAVDGLGFSIAEGEAYGLLGPNGAGKTTTISMLCGLLRPDTGEITVAGHRMDTDPFAAKALIGFVPQDLALYPDLTARENLAFFGRLQALGGADLRARVDEALAVAGLVDRADDRVEAYSGGMKRRLNIAVGLLHRPKLLVLDEPTVGVDPQSRAAILDTVEALNRQGMALLYTSHYMEEVERVCDRIGIVDEGRLIAEGTRDELVGLVGERDRVELGVEGDAEAVAAVMRQVDGVDEVAVSVGSLRLLGDDARRRLPRLLEAAERAGAVITSVEVARPTLESVFLHLTGKGLRD